MLHERSIKLRRGLLLGVGMAVLVPALATAAGYVMSEAGYRITANLTPSIPQGLYIANSDVPRQLERGQIVAFRPHNDAARYAYLQGWMKPNSVFLKTVGGVAGDTVCVDQELTIRTASTSGVPASFIRVGPVADADRQGRPLPHVLRGCQRIPYGYFLPIGQALTNSYDGRYYGLVPASHVQAVLQALWTWKGES